MKAGGLLFLMLIGTLLSGWQSESYVLAKGSKPGWIVVEFENPKCPAVESSWHGRDFLIPESGYLCTSSPIDRGYVYDRYYRIGDDGHRERLELGKEIRARSGLNLALEGVVSSQPSFSTTLRREALGTTEPLSESTIQSVVERLLGPLERSEIERRRLGYWSGSDADGSWSPALAEEAAEGVGHAEVTAINAAKAAGATVTEVAASRPICPGCAAAITEAGAKILTPLKKVP